MNRSIIFILVKVFFLVPLLLFVSFVLIALVGCLGDALCLSGKFYCGAFCIFAKSVLGLAAVLFLFFLTPEVFQLFKKLRNAASSKKQESM
jgi:hypothetical protein